MYEDWVIVTHAGNDRFLFRAPAWSFLKEGDKVQVETRYGTQYATVVYTYTVSTTREKEYEFFKCLAELGGARFPLKKIIGEVNLKEFNYTEEEDGTDKDGE